MERKKLFGMLMIGCIFIFFIMAVTAVILIGLWFRNTSNIRTQTAVALAIQSTTQAAPTITKTPSPTPTPTFTPTPTDTPTLAAGATMVSPIDGMVLVYVPKGEFRMGTTDKESNTLLEALSYMKEDEFAREKPQHTVYLDSFWIDRTEVTNAMYAKCVAEGKCTKPHDLSSYTRDKYYGYPKYDDYPVIHVDWNQAQAYCEWAGRRLPTEAEWEKAARGTDGRMYPWGNMFKGYLVSFCDKKCAFSPSSDPSWDDGYPETAPVGSYQEGASPYGALDLAGNVWEWVSDWYDSGYYLQSPSSNPQGPASGQYRVVRGGSWFWDEGRIRTAYRNFFLPTAKNYEIGFRCALNP